MKPCLAALLAAQLCAPIAAQTLIATATNYGAGCGTECPDSFYERLPAAALDLAGSSPWTIFPTGPGFVATPAGATFVPPTAAAVVLPLGDDDEVTVALTAAFPLGCETPLSSLTICANGIVSAAPGNPTSGTPSEFVMLTAPHTAWWSWHDYDPTLPGSGKVLFEEVGLVAYVTWNGVWNQGGTSALDANTFQFQFDLATGSVAIVYGAMSNLGNDHVVGFSRGGTALGACLADLSTGPTIDLCCVASTVAPLRLDALAPPKVGTTPLFRTSDLPPCTLFVAVTYGLVPIPAPGLFLWPGPPSGCYLHHDLALGFGPATLFPVGFVDAPSPWLAPVPNLIGVHVYAQALAWVGGLSGAVTSNGVELLIGDR